MAKKLTMNELRDLIKEACWKNYEQIGMKEKNGKQVPNCVPIEENNENIDSENSVNYMFWQNLKTILHATGELLKMDKNKVDALVANGHAWAVDHISTSADDIEEVYHFLESEIGSYDGDTQPGYVDEYGSVEDVNMNEAEYHGKTVKLGKPMRGDVKKFKVFVKNKAGKVLKVNFGDPNMEIKRDNPERKKSFRARHKCSQAKDRTTPKYWSCRMWSKKPVSKIVGENNDLKLNEVRRIIRKAINENMSGFDYSQINNVKFDGVDKSDYPKFVDAYIVSADYNGVPMTEEQIEVLNNDYEFVHEKLMDKLY